MTLKISQPSLNVFQIIQKLEELGKVFCFCTCSIIIYLLFIPQLSCSD